MKIQFKQEELEYFYHNYNNTSTNERKIEISLANFFINKVGETNLIETGAVMPYYGKTNHIIVDLFDKYQYCVRQDITKYSFVGKNVLSISTIEHIGTIDYIKKNPVDKKEAFKCIEKIINESVFYLITIPIGFNDVLDNDIRASNINKIVFERDVQYNFKQTEHTYFKYGFPFHNANSIFVITNI